MACLLPIPAGSLDDLRDAGVLWMSVRDSVEPALKP